MSNRRRPEIDDDERALYDGLQTGLKYRDYVEETDPEKKKELLEDLKERSYPVDEDMPPGAAKAIDFFLDKIIDWFTKENDEVLPSRPVHPSDFGKGALPTPAPNPPPTPFFGENGGFENPTPNPPPTPFFGENGGFENDGGRNDGDGSSTPAHDLGNDGNGNDDTGRSDNDDDGNSGGGDDGGDSPGSGKPIVLDLDGDGVELVALEDSTAFYDIDGDGYRERMGWVAADDGLFAYDKNGDGVISGREELSFVDYVPGARTDLEGLAHFDSNGDGRLDASDAE